MTTHEKIQMQDWQFKANDLIFTIKHAESTISIRVRDSNGLTRGEMCYYMEDKDWINRFRQYINNTMGQKVRVHFDEWFKYALEKQKEMENPRVENLGFLYKNDSSVLSYRQLWFDPNNEGTWNQQVIWDKRKEQISLVVNNYADPEDKPYSVVISTRFRSWEPVMYNALNESVQDNTYMPFNNWLTYIDKSTAQFTIIKESNDCLHFSRGFAQWQFQVTKHTNDVSINLYSYNNGQKTEYHQKNNLHKTLLHDRIKTSWGEAACLTIINWFKSIDINF